MNHLIYYKAIHNIAKKSFYGFNRLVRGIQWDAPRVQRALCNFVEYHWKKHIKDGNHKTFIRVIVPRGFGKTVNITEGFPPWVLTQDPNMDTLISNLKLENVNDFLSAIKAETSGKVNKSIYPAVYWNWERGANAWREEKINISGRTASGHNPSILTTSVEVGRTSKHPRLVIIDDPHNVEEFGETQCEAVNTHWKSLTQVIAPTAFVILITTRYGPSDIVGYID
ncbi:hypothetical protein LCGC14_2731860, partial [marine sediment metagenome]